MIRFILNNETIAVHLPPGTILLDFIRYHKSLPGTKIGCREGDCGACTIMVGTLSNDQVKYATVTSCLMPIGNAQGKHIVTIEGINQHDSLTLVQQAFAEEGATQCGFCTPGFIMSLTNHCLQEKNSSYEAAIDSVNGNICRCTGYKSIERAAAKICEAVQKGGDESSKLQAAIGQKIVQNYFAKIPGRLKELQVSENITRPSSKKLLGGGTDLYVQQHDSMPHEAIDFLLDDENLNGISKEENECRVGGAATVTDMAISPVFRESFQHLDDYIKLISSTQIRNMATVAGNIANASPIGDLSIFFLALDATLVLEKNNLERTVPLRQFYKGYKKMDLADGELIAAISFNIPGEHTLFNFEKVCKRSWLDIASVNSAILIEMENDTIIKAGIAAGGVAPVPLYLGQASEFLLHKELNSETLNELLKIVQQEISPISDVRGSEHYKRLLLSQLIKAHFIKLFPGKSFSFDHA